MNELLKIKSIVGFSLEKDYFGKINFSALGDNPNPVIRKIFLREEKSLNFVQLQNRASSILAKGSIFALHLKEKNLFDSSWIEYGLIFNSFFVEDSGDEYVLRFDFDKKNQKWKHSLFPCGVLFREEKDLFFVC
jgi:hypothetical protein